MIEQRTTNEELKRELERKQDEKLTKQGIIQKRWIPNAELKAKLEAEQDEMLATWRIHSSSDLEFSEWEKIKLPKFKWMDDLKIGFYGEIRPCNGLIDNYDKKWAKDTDIYLTFSCLKKNSYVGDSERGEPLIVHDDKPTRMTKYYCAICMRKILKDWLGILVDDFSVRKEEKLKLEKLREE